MSNMKDVNTSLRNAIDHIQHESYNDALSSILEAIEKAEAELQEKMGPLRGICRRITNCDYYGEDGEIKGVRVPLDLLHDLEFALDNNGEEG